MHDLYCRRAYAGASAHELTGAPFQDTPALIGGGGAASLNATRYPS